MNNFSRNMNEREMQYNSTMKQLETFNNSEENHVISR